jgi:hypothetical protein
VRAADGEDLALGVAGGARGGADGVGGFLRQQRLVAVHGVQRLQAPRQVGGELVGADLHGPPAAARPHGGQPAQHLRHHVGLHVAVQLGLFFFLGQRGGLAVAQVALAAAARRAGSARARPACAR